MVKRSGKQHAPGADRPRLMLAVLSAHVRSTDAVRSACEDHGRRQQIRWRGACARMAHGAEGCGGCLRACRKAGRERRPLNRGRVADAEGGRERVRPPGDVEYGAAAVAKALRVERWLTIVNMTSRSHSSEE